MIVQRIENLAGFHPAKSIILFFGLLIVPNFFLFSGYFQLFPPAGWVDPGMYLGYFLDLPGNIRDFGTTYHSMRLPFTAVGYIFHLVFPGEFANYARIALFNTTALVSIYAIAAPRYGSLTGLLSAWWLGLNPLWIAAIGRTYVDGPAIAYMLATLACWSNREIVAKRNMLTWLAGILGALAVFCHPISLVLLGIAISAMTLTQKTIERTFLQDVAWGLIGFVSATAMLGCLSWGLGGGFLFFLSDPIAITRSFNGFGANYQRPLQEWAPSAYRLAAALLIGLLGLATLRKRPESQSPLLITGLVLLVVTAMLLLIWDYGIGGTMIQSAFYTSYLLLGELLIVIALFGLVLKERSDTGLVVTLWLSALAALTYASVLLAPALWALEAARGSYVIWASIAFIFICSLSFAALRWSRSSVSAILIATILCGSLDLNTRNLFERPQTLSYRATFRTTLQVYQFVKSTVPTSHHLLFWYDRNELSALEEPQQRYGIYRLLFQKVALNLNYWDSLTSLWQWDRTSLGWSMPDIPDWGMANLRQLNKPVSIVMFCIEKDRCDLGEKQLQAIGLTPTIRARSFIHGEGYIPFEAVIIDLSV